jgi:diaminopimelate epimerase
LLLVSASRRTDCEFRYRIFNADGGEVEQCGNGARCFARFVYDKGLTHSTSIPVETAAGRLVLDLLADGQVRVDMGPPRFIPADIPLEESAYAPYYDFPVADQLYQLSCLSMGNPHGVLRVTDVATAPVQTLGPLLERHTKFPNRANIGFMQVCSRQHLKLRVYERGTGETQACGTGACAAAVAAMQLELTDRRVEVHLPGGVLQIEWPGAGHSVLMTGPATTVFEGTLAL